MQRKLIREGCSERMAAVFEGSYTKTYGVLFCILYAPLFWSCGCGQPCQVFFVVIYGYTWQQRGQSCHLVQVPRPLPAVVVKIMVPFWSLL